MKQYQHGGRHYIVHEGRLFVEAEAATEGKHPGRPRKEEVSGDIALRPARRKHHSPTCGYCHRVGHRKIFCPDNPEVAQGRSRIPLPRSESIL